MAYVDTSFLPLQSALLGCLDDAAADLTNPPAIVGVRYGQEVVFDLAQNADLCCEGLAWVRMGALTPEFGPAASYPCGPLMWTVEFEVGIVGCAPMGDDQFVVSEAEHTAANATMAEIMTALRRVICCWADLGYSRDTIVGPITPAGPMGGCLGASVTLSVRVVPNEPLIAPPEPETGFPLLPYAVGTEVGIPTGTVLTPTVGLPEPDEITTMEITHPITLETNTINAKIWRRRSWAATLQITPALGETYVFEECRVTVSLDNFCLDLIDTNGVLDIMQPLLYVLRSEFSGTDTTGRGINAAFCWIWESDIRRSEDGWGTAYGVAYKSNIIAGTDSQGDPHPDGMQVGGLGLVDAVEVFFSAGDSVIGNSAARLGTDFSRIEHVRFHRCAFMFGGYNLQVRGDPGNRGVDDVEVIDCTFGYWGFGPADFEQVTNVTWSGNVDVDGNTVPSPV